MTIVSVVIPTKDRPEYLRQALESVPRVANGLRTRAEFEVIVIDNGTAAETESVVAQAGLGAGELVTYVYARHAQGGVSAARNAGIELASGQFVAFLDDDDIWLEAHLAPHLEILENDASVVLVYAQGMLADENLRPVWSPSPPGPLPEGSILGWLLRHPLSLNTIVVAKHALITVGGFDEALSWAEDQDLLYRLAARYRFVGVKAAVTLFRQHQRVDLGNAAYWHRRFQQSKQVLDRGAQLAIAGGASRVHCLVAEFGQRGWYTYQVMENARGARARGQTWEALQLLGLGLRISPLHVGKLLAAHWRSLLA